MIKLNIVVFAILIAFPSRAFSQHVNKWRQGKLTYETKRPVSKNDSDGRKLYDADNESVGINMEVVDYSEESSDFITNPRKGCREICDDMKMKYINDGAEFLGDFKSFYIICFAKEPVITAVILRDDIEKAYEISIYCYAIEISEGIDILKSVKFKSD